MATGTGNLPNPGMAFTPFDILTAAELNDISENVDALATGSGIGDGAITPTKINLGPTTAVVATDQGTTSTSFTDLATTGPAATVTIGTNGLALAFWSAEIYNVSAQKYVGVALSGANTVAANNADAIRNDPATFSGTQTAFKLFTGLTPGPTTFTLKYRTASGTAQFSSRKITVIPL